MDPDWHLRLPVEDRQRLRQSLWRVLSALVAVIFTVLTIEQAVVLAGLMKSPQPLQAFDRHADGSPMATWPAEARRDMPYLEWREHIVRADWRPVSAAGCESAPQWRELCRALPELSDCVAGSHCTAHFLGPDGRTRLDVHVESPPAFLERSQNPEVALAEFEVLGWSRDHPNAGRQR